MSKGYGGNFIYARVIEAELDKRGALVEEAAQRGQGKVWVFVTTHEDMGSIYQNARALKGDMKKIESRFRFKFSLTTENIELVLEDRLFKKTLAGKADVASTYNENPGVLRDLGQLANTSQKLPECDQERFCHLLPVLPLPDPPDPGDRQEPPQRRRARRTALRLDPDPAGDHTGHPSDRPPWLPRRGCRRGGQLRRGLRQPRRRG